MSTSTNTRGAELACRELATAIGERVSQLGGVMQVRTQQTDVLRKATIRYRMALDEPTLRELRAALSVDRPDIDEMARRFG